MTVLSGAANANGATIITIPANQIWQGSLSVSLGSNAESALTISVSGTGVGLNPPHGTAILGTVVKPAALNVAQNGAQTSDVYVEAGNAQAKLILGYFGGGAPLMYGSATGSY